MKMLFPYVLLLLIVQAKASHSKTRSSGTVLFNQHSSFFYCSEEFSLIQHTPDPFTDHTSNQYTVDTAGEHIKQRICNVLGNLLQSFVDDQQPNGTCIMNHQVDLHPG